MSTDSRPIYERIFETLREEILQRKYNIGDRVPSEKELADDYNVSRITSKKALEMLDGKSPTTEAALRSRLQLYSEKRPYREGLQEVP